MQIIKFHLKLIDHLGCGPYNLYFHSPSRDWMLHRGLHTLDQNHPSPQAPDTPSLAEYF